MSVTTLAMKGGLYQVTFLHLVFLLRLAVSQNVACICTCSSLELLDMFALWIYYYVKCLIIPMDRWGMVRLLCLLAY